MLGELQSSHEFVTHLQHDNLGFPSCVPQLPPAKLPLIYVDCLAGGQQLWPNGVNNCGNHALAFLAAKTLICVPLLCLARNKKSTNFSVF